MQAFIHPTLLAFLFVISASSATAATDPTSTSITSNPPPANQRAPAGASSATPAPANQTTIAPANQTTIAPANQTTPAPANQTTPAPANQTTIAPANHTTPPPANQTTPPPNQTTPPPANQTTPPPNQTTPPPANQTTIAPANQTTIAPANHTTPPPANQTAPKGTKNTMPTPATPTAPTTFIKDNFPGTVPSVTSSSVTSPKTSNPNPDTTSTCQDDSCTGGSHCVSLNNIHFCLCVDGYYYNSSSCKKGKVFPGIIQVKTPDTLGLENEKSINYQNLYMEVNKFFKDVFANSDYGQTVIQRVSTSAPARSEMPAGDKVVNVTVVNLFAEDTKENETAISNAIRNAASNNSNITNYINQDRCEFYGCVKENDCSNIFQCKCQAGYKRPNPYTATCLPLSQKCSYACKSKPNTQCLVKDNGTTDCVCLAGYMKDDHEECQACAFGYNGVNCEDNFELILIILAPIAGVLILSMLIALVFVRSKKTKDTEEQNLIENDFQNLRLQQTGFGSPAGGSIFPKITASFPRDSGIQNPYAHARGMPRPDY